MVSIKSSNSITERTLLVSAYKSPKIKFQVQDWIALFDVFNYFVTVLPFVRMRKREPEKLVGLPGFAGRVNRRDFVDLT